MTYEAIMRTWTIIRIRAGVTFLNRETVTFDMVATKIRLSPMIKVLINKLVTARAEQIPRICLKTGFSSQIPLKKILRLLSFGMR
jgi:hypothetical protein